MLLLHYHVENFFNSYVQEAIFHGMERLSSIHLRAEAVTPFVIRENKLKLYTFRTMINMDNSSTLLMS